MVGFVNALAILIFVDQVPEMTDAPWSVHPPIIGGLALMAPFPKITTVIQAPLVSIVIRTVITIGAAIAVPTVGDKGDLPSPLPVPGLPVPSLPGLPDVPFTPRHADDDRPVRVRDGAGRPDGVADDGLRRVRDMLAPEAP